MNATMFSYRQWSSKLLIGLLLSILLASWTIVAAAGSEPEAANSYAAAWERYLAAATPEDLAPQNFGKTWDRFLALQNMEPVGAFLVPMDVGEDLSAAAFEPILPWEIRGVASAESGAAAFEPILPWEVRGVASAESGAMAFEPILPWEVRGVASAESGAVAFEPILPWDVSGVAVASSSLSEGGNRYGAAWQRYLAAGTPEDLGDLGATWARFWDTQAVEPVGAYLVRTDVSGADLAASRGLAAANEYAAAWQNFLAGQNPQSVALDNWGGTWTLFWANVEAGGIAETENGFEVVCCR